MRIFRRAGGGAGSDRIGRGDGVHGDATVSGDRDSHGTGGRAGAGAVAGAAGHGVDGRHGGGDRTAGGVGRDTADQNFLFGLTPQDPVSIVLATIGLMIVTGLAGYFPARRATRVDPLVAL